jgi:putative transposase
VEYATVADLLRDSDVSVSETYYRHLDSGEAYVASESTFYRIAKAEAITMARTGPGRKRAKSAGQEVMPQLCATAAGQVVCWDISFLPGLYRGQRFALYLVIDLYSRKIVGWAVEDGEDEVRARDLIELVVDDHQSTVETVHSDNGAAMKSTRMKTMLESKDVALSTIRPGVSNDNAQIESAFRTVKYGPTWPGVFDDIAEARDWFAEYVRVYNGQHHHSSLAGFTPGEVYDGSWIDTAHKRQERLDAAWQARPERYRHRPQVKVPPQKVTLNLVNEPGSTHTPATLVELLAV